VVGLPAWGTRVIEEEGVQFLVLAALIANASKYKFCKGRILIQTKLNFIKEMRLRVKNDNVKRQVIWHNLL